MKKLLLLIPIYLLLSSSIVNTSAVQDDYDTSYTGTNMNSFFTEVFESSIYRGGVLSELNQFGSPGSNMYEGINHGLALVTAIKLFDIYRNQYYLDIAISLSDFIATYLLDPRYELISSFYDLDSQYISNYRNMEDNLLLVWGLTELANRLNPSETILIKKQKDRADYLLKDISLFLETSYFNPTIRIDNPSTPTIFNAYHNLFSAFIITQDEVKFSSYLPTVIKVFNFVRENVSTTTINEETGVHTISTKGFHDDIVSLRNTALYTLLALRLYEIYEDQTYYDEAIKSINYIRAYSQDVGVTGGYFESMIDNKPIQEAKSLSSHAFLLLAFLKLAKYEGEAARIDLLSLWQTIMDHFAYSTGSNQYVFYSTISRDGSSGSAQIDTFDNFLMLYSLSEMPLLAKVDLYSEVQFSDLVDFNVKYAAPVGVDFNISVYIYDDYNNELNLVYSEGKTGTNVLHEETIKFTPPRPESNRDYVQFEIKIESESLVTDIISGSFSVIKDTGLVLSTQTVTLFSVLLIIVFVYFLRSLSTKETEAT